MSLDLATNHQIKGENLRAKRRIKSLAKKEATLLRGFKELKQLQETKKMKYLTLDRMIRIEAATHDQKTPCDLMAFANVKRWSKSKGDFERYGDLTLPNLIRAMRKEMVA